MSRKNKSRTLISVSENNHIMVSLFILMLTTSCIVPATARITTIERQKRHEVSERSVFVKIAKELLSHLVTTNSIQKRDAEETSMTAIGEMAREGATLGLMAYMAFEQEDDCIERLVCDVTERLNLMTNSVGLLVTAADFVTPQEYRTLLNVARESVNGASCFYYKCGALPFHPVDDDDVS